MWDAQEAVATFALSQITGQAQWRCSSFDTGMDHGAFSRLHQKDPLCGSHIAAERFAFHIDGGELPRRSPEAVQVPAALSVVQRSVLGRINKVSALQMPIAPMTSEWSLNRPDTHANGA
jgi:hypothetical protein